MHGIVRYESKTHALGRLVAQKQVLHLGAIGETLSPLEVKVSAIQHSVHAYLTREASRCIGVDYDEAAVDAICSAGKFTNLICRDIFELNRDDIDLQTIDCIVAGDVIEHLANPGLMLDVVRSISDRSTVLILTVPNSEGLPQFLRYAAGKRIEGGDHKVSFNVYTLKNLLEDRGWTVTDVIGCYQPTAGAMNGSLRFRAGRTVLQWLPSLAGTLLVVARQSS